MVEVRGRLLRGANKASTAFRALFMIEINVGTARFGQTSRDGREPACSRLLSTTRPTLG